MTTRTTVSIRLVTGDDLLLGTDPGESLRLDDFREYMKECTDSFVHLDLIDGSDICIAVDKILSYESVDVPRPGGVRLGGKYYPGKYEDES